MKTKSLILLLLLSTQWLVGQKLTPEEWQDSIRSATYIGIELTLDEMFIDGVYDSLSDPTFGFYKNNPLNTTEDVLSRLPGISMIRRGNYAWEPTVNGLSAGQINVTINGMRVFGACTDKMDPVSSYVEPNNLESIRVEKGCSGSDQGSSVGGSVSFGLKKPKFNSKISGSLNSRYETVANGFSQSASVNYGADDFAIRLNGGFRKFKDYTDGNGDEVHHSGFTKMNFSIATSFRTKNSNLINVDVLVDDAKDVGYPGLPMDVAFAKARMVSLNYLFWTPVPNIEQIELKGYYNSINHLMDDSKRSDIPVRMDMPGNTETFGAYATAKWKTKRKHSLYTKVDWYSTNAYAEMTMYIPNESDMFMLTWPDIDRHDIGLFASDEIKFNPRTSININGRFEFAYSAMQSEMGQQQFSVFGYAKEDFFVNHLLVNSGMSLSHGLTKDLTMKTSLSYGERLPSSSELYGFYLYNSYDGYDYIGNPKIAKEKSAQLTAALEYQIGEKLQISIGGFYYHFDDYIIGYIDETLDAMTIGAQGVKVYQNIDGVNFWGLDASITYSPSRYFQMLYAMKVTYAQDGDGNPLPMIPPMKNYLTLVGQKNGYKIQGEAEFSLAQKRVSESTGEMSTSKYFLLNLRTSKSFKFNKTQLKASLGVENLLNTAYRDHLDWGGILRPGRNVYVSVGFEF